MISRPVLILVLIGSCNFWHCKSCIRQQKSKVTGIVESGPWNSGQFQDYQGGCVGFARIHVRICCIYIYICIYIYNGTFLVYFTSINDQYIRIRI